MKNLSRKTKIIIVAVAAVIVIGIIACVIMINGDSPDKAEVLLPDILMPKNTTYVTEKTDTSVTVEGYIATPADENPVPESLDDPDFVYPDETVSYIYKSHSHKFDEEGNLYILIEYERTTKSEASAEFKITVEDEAIAECPGIYLECNGYTHKVW